MCSSDEACDKTDWASIVSSLLLELVLLSKLKISSLSAGARLFLNSAKFFNMYLKYRCKANLKISIVKAKELVNYCSAGIQKKFQK